jgi:hypothetical protein
LAGVAKWLRQWVVVPPFAGSSPVTRPCLNFFKLSIYKKIIYKYKLIFMSRYRGPKLRISRRLGTLPGLTTKKSNKINRPGKDGNANADTGKKLTEYGVRLEEKQKLKFNYGLTESQLFDMLKKHVVAKELLV